MLEPVQNPNSKWMVDPPPILRWLMSKVMGRVASTGHINKNRRAVRGPARCSEATAYG